jgi:proteasome lid subunit RPN8/RPN11
MKNTIKNFIKKHALEDFPNECCGFIVKDNKKIKCIKTKNISKQKNYFFKVSIEDFLNIKDNYNILYIYHSHTIDNSEFSGLDKSCAKHLMVDMVLYNIKQDQFNYFKCK